MGIPRYYPYMIISLYNITITEERRKSLVSQILQDSKSCDSSLNFKKKTLTEGWRTKAALSVREYPSHLMQFRVCGAGLTKGLVAPCDEQVKGGENNTLVIKGNLARCNFRGGQEFKKLHLKQMRKRQMCLCVMWDTFMLIT